MSNHGTPDDSSKSIIRLLTFLVVLLATLVVLCLIGIGGLLLWKLNADDSVKAQTVVERQAVAPVETEAEAAQTIPVDESMANDSTVEDSSEVVEAKPEPVASPEPKVNVADALAPLPVDLAKQQAVAEDSLSYKLDRKSPVMLDFSNIISAGNAEVRNKGRITYRFLEDDPFEYLRDVVEDSGAEGAPFSLAGNGTGFIVHPEGLLVTCAHVVEGVSEVNVKLGEADFPGSVVAIDEKHDLALVKIDAGKPLPYLRLASETPALGTSARVFGFPLADRLGRSMKLTTGTVTGIDQVNDSRRLQLDATANPGNSGGPVTGDDGSVLGVVDSILAGGKVADMSFAVPVKELQNLLDSQSIAYHEDAEPANELSISSLDEVSKAVAMIEISSEQTAKSWKVVDVTVKNRVSTGGRDMRFLMHRNPLASSKTTTARIVLNSRGKLIHCNDSQFLPGIVQNLASIGLMELPSGSPNKWTLEESLLMQTETTERESSRQRDPFGFPFDMHPGFRRHPFASPFDRGGDREVTKQVIRAVEINDEYEATPFRKPILEFRQRRKVITRDLAENGSRDTTILRGTTVFNPEIGWTERGELKGKLNLTLEGQKKEVDVTYSFRFISEKEIEKESNLRKERVAEAKKKAEAREKAALAKTEALDMLSDGEPGFPGFEFFKHEDADEAAKDAPEKLPRVVARIPKRTGQGQVAISPDGNLVAVGSSRNLTLYRIDETGKDFKQIAMYDGGTHRVTGSAFLKFSIDSQRIAAGNSLGRVQVLELKKDRLRELSFFKCDMPLTVAMAPGGHRLAFFHGRKRELVVVDVDTEKELMNLSGELYPGPVHDLVFSANGEQLIVSQGKNAAQVNIADQEVVETAEWPFEKAAGQTRFAGSGRYVIGSRQAFDVITGESFNIPSHDECFAVCGKGQWFVHLAEKFDKLVQFHRVDGSERYKIDTGSKSGHWNSFDIAVFKNRMVAFEVFSKSVFVLEF